MSESIDWEEVRRHVAHVIADEVAPLLQMDGTGIEVVAIDNGVVQIRLHGVCGCCPSSVQAVVMGIEEELRRRIPNIEYLELVP